MCVRLFRCIAPAASRLPCELTRCAGSCDASRTDACAPQWKRTVDGVERYHVQTQINDRNKAEGWVRAKEKGQPILVPEGQEFTLAQPPSNMSAAEKLKWEKHHRGNALPTVYADGTKGATPTVGKGKATGGAIPGSINWGIQPVNVTLVEKGKIGVTWVPVRDAKTGSEAVTIETITEDGQMDQHRLLGASVCPGLALSKVNGRTTAGMTYAETISFLKTAGRPLKMQFAGIARDTSDEVQAALTRGEKLPAHIDTKAAFHEMAGKSKVAEKQKGKVYAAELGRKRTAKPVKIFPGEGGESGHVDITSAEQGKKPVLLETLSYLEIQHFWVDRMNPNEPFICFAHRPDPEGLARNIRLFLPEDDALALADAVMQLLREIHERRNPEAAFQPGGSKWVLSNPEASGLSNAFFGDSGTGDNPLFDDMEDT